MFEEILIPVDGSEHSKRAIETAANLAVHYESRVEVLHVMEKIGVSRMPEGFEELEHLEHIRVTDSDILMDVATSIVNQAVGRCRELGVKQVGHEIVIGNPREMILSIAQKNSTDLIVMGRRGLGRIADLMLGSVSHRVTQTADCACLTVK